MRRIVLVVLLACLLGRTVQAQTALPASARLEGVSMVYQDINRCSAAAFTMLLSYWVEEPVDYHLTIGRLNPNIRDVSVRLEEMAQVAAQVYSLESVIRRGGDAELMKRLVAAGFPVLVENSYYDGNNAGRDWMSHNRVLMGYDEALQEFYFFDSLLGNGEDKRGRAMTYADFDERWLAFNRDYLVVYPLERAAEMEALLGDRWDTRKNAQIVIDQAVSDHDTLSSRADQAFALMNMAYGYMELGDSEFAAQLVDEVRTSGALPWRYFWYDFTVFDIYLAQGREGEVIDLANATLAAIPGKVEELYYYIGVAAQTQGDLKRARSNYEAALQYNLYYIEAIDALAALDE